MKGKALNIVLILIFLAGLSLLLYPTVSDYINTLHNAKLIESYSQQVEQLEEDTYRQEWDQAQAYNAALLERADGFTIDITTRNTYYQMLNTTGRNVMGYIEIPAIGCTLPIGHGTEEDTLQKTVGHLEWSSLPVGGESTHCVLSGHRGLPSSELFTNIDHLELGDNFYLHVLGQTLEYTVDNIAIVDPYDYTLLGIEEGKDYTTLVTCTPYGINSHRLLVRGIRVLDQEETPVLEIKNEVTDVDVMVIVPIGVGILALGAFVLLLLGNRKKKGKEGRKNA